MKKLLFSFLAGCSILLASCGGTINSSSNNTSTSQNSSANITSSNEPTDISGRELFDMMYDNLSNQKYFTLDADFKSDDTYLFDANVVISLEEKLSFRLDYAMGNTLENVDPAGYIIGADNILVTRDIINNQTSFSTMPKKEYIISQISSILGEEYSIDIKAIIENVLDYVNVSINIVDDGYNYIFSLDLDEKISPILDFIKNNKDVPLGELILNNTSCSKEDIINLINEVLDPKSSAMTSLNKILNFLNKAGLDFSLKDFVNELQDVLMMETNTFVDIVNGLMGDQILPYPGEDKTIYDVIESMLSMISTEVLLQAINPELTMDDAKLMLEMLLFGSEQAQAMTLGTILSGFTLPSGGEEINLLSVIDGFEMNVFKVDGTVLFDEAGIPKDVTLNLDINTSLTINNVTNDLLNIKGQLSISFNYPNTIDDQSIFKITEKNIYSNQIIMFDTNEEKIDKVMKNEAIEFALLKTFVYDRCTFALTIDDKYSNLTLVEDKDNNKYNLVLNDIIYASYVISDCEVLGLDATLFTLTCDWSKLETSSQNVTLEIILQYELEGQYSNVYSSIFNIRI